MESEIRYRRDIWKLMMGVDGDAVEIGVAEGYFSADLLSMPAVWRHVYLVDRWRCVPTQKGDASNPQTWHDANLAATRERVARFGRRAVFLRGDSYAMVSCVPNQSLSLVYVDGDHSLEGVLADIQAWESKLMVGGVMAFHDYLAPQYGVRQVVDQFAKQTGRVVHLIPEDKPEDAGAWFRW